MRFPMGVYIISERHFNLVVYTAFWKRIAINLKWDVFSLRGLLNFLQAAYLLKILVIFCLFLC